MPINNHSKFDEDWIRTVEVKEQTRSIWPNLDNSRTIIQNCLGQIGWLSLCQEPILLSLVKIEIRLFHLESGQG